MCFITLTTIRTHYLLRDHLGQPAHPRSVWVESVDSCPILCKLNHENRRPKLRL